MVELMSKIIQNAPAGHRGEGNSIEQKEDFVQLMEGKTGEEVICWLFWQGLK